jgi:uncharacterized protein (DUF433 family)
MLRRKISQKEIIRDIRSGMDDAAIRNKYQLSLKGLEDLYRKLIAAGLLGNDLQPITRKLNLLAILADIRAGMKQSDLLKKYELSEDMLREVSKKLLSAQGKRLAIDADTVIVEPAEFLSTRESVRHELDFDVTVYEADLPETFGMVRDVSEESISVSGVESNVGDSKTLVVLGDELGQFSSFEFEGSCLWEFTDAADGTCVAGFAISKISDTDAGELRKLVRLVITGG